MLRERKIIYAKFLGVMFIPYILLVIRFSACKGLIDILESMEEHGIIYVPALPSGIIRIIITATLIYLLFMLCFLLNMKNYRYDEEYGSAKLGSAALLGRKYSCRQGSDEADADERNLCLTKKVDIGLDVYRHNRNLNTLIIGGSGAMKTRGYVIPNILRANCSYIITDPKGEILRKTGSYLKKEGYEIRVLDLKQLDKSNGYNPFKYFRGDSDILKFVVQSWEAMSDKTAAKGEEIWDNQAKNMLMSLMMYLYHYAPSSEQNFDMVMKLVQEIKASEGARQEITAIDVLFEAIDHDSPTYGYYKGWSAAKGRTLASIVATLTAKLTVFNLDSIRKLTMCDELDFTSIAERKVALFCVIPDSDKSYNFLAGTMYSQLIQELYDYADNVCNGPLKRHVRFIMDEFANIALPDDYEKILSTARSRNISFAIILQDKSQIEALYEKVYKSLIANCDCKLFLGSSEPETCKFFVELMGKETVYIKTVNTTHGANSSSTSNISKAAREIFTPDELVKLNNNKCVLIIRGEDPVVDYKIQLKKCKNYKKLCDGGRSRGKIYDWGEYETAGSASIINSSYSGRIIPLPDTTSKLIA